MMIRCNAAVHRRLVEAPRVPERRAALHHGRLPDTSPSHHVPCPVFLGSHVLYLFHWHRAGLWQPELCEGECLIAATAAAATPLRCWGQQGQGLQGMGCAHVFSSAYKWWGLLGCPRCRRFGLQTSAAFGVTRGGDGQQSLQHLHQLALSELALGELLSHSA